MIKVSHEVPLSLLEDSRNFNDYDYALVHLFETQPEYLQFYKESVSRGRDVLLDNSIFELGKAFEAKSFVKWIEELKPTRYVIPDVLGNSKETIRNAEKWIKEYPDLPGESIGVVQGSNLFELTQCYLRIAELCDQIAICFHYPYYDQSDAGRALGRQNLIAWWLKMGVIKETKKHHLLGCSLPQEFAFYKNSNFIYSLDTSNPIVHGLKGIRYKEWGLPSKEKIKLVDLLEEKPSPRQLEDIYFNVEAFKKIISK